MIVMRPVELLKTVADEARTLRMEITITPEDKLELIALGIAASKKFEETTEKVDRNWKRTHWLIAIGMGLNIIASYIFLTM